MPPAPSVSGQDPADLALPGSSELVACPHSSREPCSTATRASGCSKTPSTARPRSQSGPAPPSRSCRSSAPAGPRAEPLLELATVEEPRFRITRRQLGQASLAPVARGRVPNGDELSRGAALVRDDPARQVNADPVATPITECHLGVGLAVCDEARVPCLCLVSVLRGPERERGRRTQEHLALEAEKLAEPAVDRADLVCRG